MLTNQASDPHFNTWEQDFASWNPGLDNDDKTLREVFDTMPRTDLKDVSWLCKTLEEPGPFSFRGFPNIFCHDCIHVLLGRGLNTQDEVFIIGYTMGTCRPFSRIQVELYRILSLYIYKPPYSYPKEEIDVMDLGIVTGKANPVPNLHLFPFDKHMDVRLGELRRQLGVDVDQLYRAFEIERGMRPGVPASLRLPRRPPPSAARS